MNSETRGTDLILALGFREPRIELVTLTRLLWILASIKPPRIEVKPGKFLSWEELLVIDFGKQTSRIQFLALHGIRSDEATTVLTTDIL